MGAYEDTLTPNLSPTDLYLCQNENVVRLSAPNDYDSYTWTRSSNPSWRDYNQRLVVYDAIDNEVFTCKIIYVTGCYVEGERKITIRKITANADFTYSYNPCNYTAVFTDLSSVIRTTKDSILWEIPELNVKNKDSIFTYTFPEPIGNEPDTYKVCLWVFSESGCLDNVLCENGIRINNPSCDALFLFKIQYFFLIF